MQSEFAKFHFGVAVNLIVGSCGHSIRAIPLRIRLNLPHFAAANYRILEHSWWIKQTALTAPSFETVRLPAPLFDSNNDLATRRANQPPRGDLPPAPSRAESGMLPAPSRDER